MLFKATTRRRGKHSFEGKIVSGQPIVSHEETGWIALVPRPLGFMIRWDKVTTLPDETEDDAIVAGRRVMIEQGWRETTAEALEDLTVILGERTHYTLSQISNEASGHVNFDEPPEVLRQRIARWRDGVTRPLNRDGCPASPEDIEAMITTIERHIEEKSHV